MKQPCLGVGRLPSTGAELPFLVAVIAVLLLAGSGLAESDNMFVYPARGQSQAQLDRDRFECHSWAVRQTGFDPTRSAPTAMPPPPPATQYQPSRRHVIRGAGGGAALGAVGGAIAGDAGTGAAAGAAMGAIVGGVRRRRERGSTTSSNNRCNRITHNSTPPSRLPSRPSSQHISGQRPLV
jgi:hypothetical protein